MAMHQSEIHENKLHHCYLSLKPRDPNGRPYLRIHPTAYPPRSRKPQQSSTYTRGVPPAPARFRSAQKPQLGEGSRPTAFSRSTSTPHTLPCWPQMGAQGSHGALLHATGHAGREDQNPFTRRTFRHGRKETPSLVKLGGTALKLPAP